MIIALTNDMGARSISLALRSQTKSSCLYGAPRGMKMSNIE